MEHSASLHKALKWSIRNYWKNALKEIVFYSKSLDESMSPRTLDETLFGANTLKESDKNKLRLGVLKNILSCLDVRTFGGTYAGKTNISIHGTCQIYEWNNKPMAIGFIDYETKINSLKFKSVHFDFKLIDQENISCFIPLKVPVTVDGVDDKISDPIFSKLEIDF